jgi:glycosyltransferase involved in cell wall biosynthesis
VAGSTPKIALVYDWLTNMGGGERALFALHKAFPDAPIYTSVYIPEACGLFKDADVRTTYLQKLPRFLRKRHQLFPMLRPRAFRALDLSEYDIIISMGSAEAKAVRKRPDALHINYCFTPIRYYWSHYEDYKKNPGLGFLNPLVRLVIPPFVATMRKADLRAAEGVDHFISISSAISERIKTYYGKPASALIYPPVDMTRFRPLDISGPRKGFIITGRQVAYKRMDLAIAACNKLGTPLTLMGNGAEHKKLVAMAGPSVKFVVGTVGSNDNELENALAHAEGFLNPQDEDFGITHIEAMAAGCPIVALAKGGALDTMIEGKTGVFIQEQTVDALAAGMQKLQSTRFAPKVLQMHAEQFSEERFIQEIKDCVASSYSA